MGVCETANIALVPKIPHFFIYRLQYTVSSASQKVSIKQSPVQTVMAAVIGYKSGYDRRNKTILAFSNTYQ